PCPRRTHADFAVDHVSLDRGRVFRRRAARSDRCAGYLVSVRHRRIADAVRVRDCHPAPGAVDRANLALQRARVGERAPVYRLTTGVGETFLTVRLPGGERGTAAPGGARVHSSRAGFSAAESGWRGRVGGGGGGVGGGCGGGFSPLVWGFQLLDRGGGGLPLLGGFFELEDPPVRRQQQAQENRRREERQKERRDGAHPPSGRSVGA